MTSAVTRISGCLPLHEGPLSHQLRVAPAYSAGRGVLGRDVPTGLLDIHMLPARAGLLLHTFSTSLVVINEIGFEPMNRVEHAEKLIYSPDPSTRTGSAGPKS